MNQRVNQVEKTDRLVQTKVEYAPKAPEIKLTPSATTPEITTAKQPESIKKLPRTPEAILARVKASAEKGIPIEALYEKRHEVKDENLHTSQPALGGGHGFTPVAAIRLAAATTSLVKHQEKIENKYLDLLRSQAKSKPMYRQAVVGGFWGAVVILVMVMVLAIVR